MPVPTAASIRIALIAALVLLLHAPHASALSKRDRAAVEAIDQRMLAAEQRYREALVAIGNNDPDGVDESNAAIEDMEDVIADCLEQDGCRIAEQIAVYKRLLKVGVDAEAGLAGGEDRPDAPAGDIGIAAAVPEAARAASLLGDERERFDALVQGNPAVQAGIRRWLTDMRGSLIDSYENYQYMRHLMWPSFEKSALPEALLFGIMAKESNGRVHSTSRAGAAGPMQFMYATGKRFGLGVDATGFDTRYDPYASAQASAAYLNERMAELDRSIEMALAAYNGGEGRALRIHQASDGRGFWNAGVYEQFPPETRDYVPMVIAAAWLFLHPEQYGLSLPEVKAKPAMLQLEKPASIYELTICLGNGGTREGFMRALRNLNPRYDADSWLPAGVELDATSQIVDLYQRHCVDGARAQLAQQLVTSDPEAAIVTTPPAATVPTTVATGVATPAAEPRQHEVVSGDTLVGIARRYACDTRTLAQANDLKAPRYAIRPGQRLELAGCADP